MIATCNWFNCSLKISRWHLGTCFLAGNRFPTLVWSCLSRPDLVHLYWARWHSLWMTKPGWPTPAISVTIHQLGYYYTIMTLSNYRKWDITSKDLCTAQQLHLSLWRKTLLRVMLPYHGRTSPQRILHSYQQHIADCVHLFMPGSRWIDSWWRSSHSLNFGGISFNTTVIDLFTVSFPFHVLHNPISISRPWQKICLADNIRKMADHLHEHAIQQLEVELLGSSAAEVMDLLSAQFI